MNLDEFTATVINGFKAKFPKIKQIEEYDNQFNADVSSKIPVAPPCIFVVMLSVDVKDEEPGTGELDATVRMGAYVVSNNARSKAARNTDALRMAGLTILVVKGNRWNGGEKVQPAKVERAIPVVSKQLGANGISVWAVTWKQEIRIGIDEWDGVGVIPSELYVGIAPDTGADGSYGQVL